MKHLIFITVLFAAISTSTMASSGSGEGSSIKIVPGDKKFEVKYLSSPKGTVKVNIYDANSKRIYADVIKTSKGFIRPYNFTGAPAGIYTIEIIDGDNVVTEEVTYGQSKTNLKVQVDPMDGKKYKIAVVGLQKEAVYVNIYDRAQNLVYSDQVNTKNSFSRIYDLSRVPSNEFTFEISSSDSSFKQSVIQ